MAIKAKVGSVWKEKKVRDTSPSNSNATYTANRHSKIRAKQPSPIPQPNPLPNYLKPTARSSRLVASKTRKIPAAASPASPKPYLHRRSFGNKSNPNPNPPAGGGARKSLHKSQSLFVSSKLPTSSNSVSRPSRAEEPGRRPAPALRRPRNAMRESIRKDSNYPNGAAKAAPRSISTCPDLDDSISNMESEHEEAEGFMGCAIDDELAEIESRGMNPYGLISPALEDRFTDYLSSTTQEIEAQTNDFDEKSSNLKGEENEVHTRAEDPEEVKALEGSNSKNEAYTKPFVQVEAENPESKDEIGEGAKGEAKNGSGEESKAVENAKSQSERGNWRKESQRAYNDVIEATKSKLLEERKNKVRALVGAFETVISLQDP